MVPVLLWSSYLIVAVVLLLCFLHCILGGAVELRGPPAAGRRAGQLFDFGDVMHCVMLSVFVFCVPIGRDDHRVASMDDRMVERSINSYSY